MRDDRWLLRAMAFLLPAGLVWFANKQFVVQMCINNHAWWTIGAFAVPLLLAHASQYWLKTIHYRRVAFMGELLGLGGLSIMLGQVTWVYWS